MWVSMGGFFPRTLFGNNLPFRDGQARVKKARGDLAGAIEIYRNLLVPDTSQKWTAVLEPRYVLELARLFSKTGDREAARKEYQRFLDLWKDANPDLPEVKQALVFFPGWAGPGKESSGRPSRSH